MTLGIRDFHNFVMGKLKEKLSTRYKDFKILTEADLQAYAWRFVRDFLRPRDPTRRRFHILNKPFLKDLGIHPDMAVFDHRQPWAVFEVKESRTLPETVARKERKRLLTVRTVLKPPPKRGYLLYAVRSGGRRVLHGPKTAGARYFFEVSIRLPGHWSNQDLRKWEQERRKWSKYTSDQSPTER